MDLTNILRAISLGLCVLVCGALLPATWRVVARRQRSLDPIWFSVFFLFLNRVAFLFQGMTGIGAMLDWCYVSAIIATGIFAINAWGYIRHERP